MRALRLGQFSLRRSASAHSGHAWLGKAAVSNTCSHWWPTVALIVVLTGCGNLYSVKPLSGANGSDPHGFEYRLPRNLIEVSVSVTTRKVVQGNLTEWAQACGITSVNSVPPKSISFDTPTFQLIVNPQKADRFIVSLSPPRWPLYSRSFQMKLDANATPVSVSSHGDDATIALAQEVVGRVTLPTFADIGADSSEPAQLPALASLTDASGQAKGSEKEQVDCKDSREASRTQSEIQSVNDQLESMMSNVVSDPRSVDIAIYERMVNDLLDRRKQLVAQFLGNIATTSHTETIVVDPSHCKARSCNWRLLKTGDRDAYLGKLQTLGGNRHELISPEHCEKGNRDTHDLGPTGDVQAISTWALTQPKACRGRHPNQSLGLFDQIPQMGNKPARHSRAARR